MYVCMKRPLFILRVGWKEAFMCLIRVLITLETSQGCSPGWIDEEWGEQREWEEYVHALKLKTWTNEHTDLPCQPLWDLYLKLQSATFFFKNKQKSASEQVIKTFSIPSPYLIHNRKCTINVCTVSWTVTCNFIHFITCMYIWGYLNEMRWQYRCKC